MKRTRRARLQCWIINWRITHGVLPPWCWLPRRYWQICCDGYSGFIATRAECVAERVAILEIDPGAVVQIRPRWMRPVTLVNSGEWQGW